MNKSLTYSQSVDRCYLTGKCSCILAISPMEGSERVYIVARMARTTNSQEEGLAGYTPLLTQFC